MKILDWVHRKLHHNHHDYSMVSGKKDTVISDAKKTKITLLEGGGGKLFLDQKVLSGIFDNVFDNVYDNWDEGILSIGTFGIHPFSPLNDPHEVTDRHVESLVVGQEEEGYEQEPKEVKTFTQDLELTKISTQILSEKVTFKIDSRADNPLFECTETQKFNNDSENEKRKTGGRKTTLAGLFSVGVPAGLVSLKTGLSGVIPPDSSKTTVKEKKKHGFSFAKNLMSKKVEDFRSPHTKLHKMLAKMMKRKIHPEVSEDIETASNLDVKDRDGLPTSDSGHETAVNGSVWSL